VDQLAVARLRHPTLDRRSVVLWPGDKGRRLVELADPQVVGTIAVALPLASRNTSLINLARARLGYGLAFEGEAWRNQLEPNHRHRGKHFQALGYHQPGKVLKPDASPFGEQLLDTIAAPYINEQIRAGGTLLTTPGHYSDHPIGAARGNDLALAARCAEIFAARALSEPAPNDKWRIRRALYATIVVRPDRLDRRAIGRMVDGYAEVVIDGYWIWAVNYTGTATGYRLLRELALLLQERTGRPSVVGGLGWLWQGAVRNGIAAACFGRHRGSLMLPAPDDSPTEEQDEDDRGWGTAVYLGEVLGAFRIGEPGDAQRRQAFLRFGCPCGHHPARIPPQTQVEQIGHNLWWLMQEARLATAAGTARATTDLEQRRVAAAHWRSRLGMGPLKGGWRAATALEDVEEQLP
jgi:hypothetical protein